MIRSLKVSSKSAPHSVAGALAGILRESVSCEIQVIGAGALNQAVKAIAIGRTYLLDDGIDIVCVPRFAEVEIDDRIRTAIRLEVERRDHVIDIANGADIGERRSVCPDALAADLEHT